jgi:hypothetical protein
MFLSFPGFSVGPPEVALTFISEKRERELFMKPKLARNRGENVHQIKRFARIKNFF